MPALARDCAPAVHEARPVPVAQAGDITVGTQNLQRFFDDVEGGRAPVVSTAEYQRRMEKLARQVVDVLRQPDLLAVQEAENEAVLHALAAAVAAKSGRSAYQVRLFRGPDRGGHNSGFLIRADWQVLELEPLLVTQRLGRAPLFDRPPLRLLLRTAAGERLEVVNVHLKSLRGSEEAAEAKRIARKRRRQAEALAVWLTQYLARQPALPLLVIGDFNATPAAEDGVDVLGRLMRTGLTSALTALPAVEHYSYVHDCRPLALDHALLSPALSPRLRAAAYSRGNAGAPARYAREATHALRSADHDGLVLYLRP